MITRNGTDTIIGFIPGADIDEGAGAVKGGLAKAPAALQKLLGWKGTPALGGYTYPAGGGSEDWDFQKALGFTGLINYKAFAIPNGLTIADVRAGKADAIWIARAKNMVKEGQGNCTYSCGYEGSDKNFNGSAGQPVPSTTLGAVQTKQTGWVLGAANWAYAISRQVNVMRTVTGWDCWIDINYDVTMALGMGLDPDPFHLITEKFQSIGTEFYPIDSWNGQWSAATDEKTLLAYLTSRIAAQAQAAKKYNVALTIGEMGPMIRTDTHASGDDPAFVQLMHDICMDPAYNVAFAFLYNGTTGDTSRVFLWDQASGTYKVDTVKFPKSAAAIKTLLDPALFINKPVTPPPPVSYTKAQLDAAVAAAVAPLQTQLAAAQASVAAAQVALQQAQDHAAADDVQVATLQGQLGVAQAKIAAASRDLA